MSFATTWMESEGITLSQKEKDNFGMISLICGIQRKKKEKIPDSQKRLLKNILILVVINIFLKSSHDIKEAEKKKGKKV